MQGESVPFGVDQSRHPLRQWVGDCRLSCAGRTGNVDVVPTNQLVGLHEQIAQVDCETLAELMVNLKTALLGVRRPRVVVHATLANSASSGGKARAGHLHSGKGRIIGSRLYDLGCKTGGLRNARAR